MLLWLDMEMTGLDVTKEVPIEVAAIVTDWQFQEKTQYHAIIQQPKEYLDRMDDWNKEHHTASGLLAQIPTGRSPAAVEQELCQLVKTHFGSEKPILAGNSIGQDRLFIHRYFPQLEALLHYRMLDVSAWKIVFNTRFNKKFAKSQNHRALDDVRESIGELNFYMQFIRPDSPAS